MEEYKNSKYEGTFTIDVYSKVKESKGGGSRLPHYYFGHIINYRPAPNSRIGAMDLCEDAGEDLKEYFKIDKASNEEDE